MKKIKTSDKIGWAVSALLVAVAVSFIIYIFLKFNSVDYNEF
jgi:hypothetical protein